jgi:hypothetical protein
VSKEFQTVPLRAPAALRDCGPYSTRNTGKGALIDEAGQVFGALARGMTVDQVRRQVFAGSLLRQRSVNSRKGAWKQLHYRYLAHGIAWVTSALVEGWRQGSQSLEFASLLYLHYALRDRLTFDFVGEVLWTKGYRSRSAVSRNEVLDLLDGKAADQPRIARWTQSSRVKLAGNVLSALRDFGVLEGVQKKFLVRPPLPPSTAAHLVRVLVAEGVRGREVVEDPTWRLFLLTEREVAACLSRLAAAGVLRFEKAGTTVVLQTPQAWEEGP